jgi:hypothetical protein
MMRIQSVTVSSHIMTSFVSSEFHIFAEKPVQESVLETTEVINEPISSVDQSDLEFLICLLQIISYVPCSVSVVFL